MAVCRVSAVFRYVFYVMYTEALHKLFSGGWGGGGKALKNILSSMLHCVCFRGYIFLIL